ncbi:MAG TPA: NlpC/P60 family protein [Actinomycetota bacterium]|nr:NlpC/P60 family protein [Actinomycetota bacterium]
MRGNGRGHGHRVRPAAAALLALSLLVAPATSSAAPTRAEIEAAEARLRALHERLSLLVEQYDQARERLAEVQARLDEARRAAAEARETAERARTLLSRRAASAYMTMGTEAMVLLDASSLAEFSDRLEFIGRIAQDDADLALQAEAAGRRASWLGERLRDVARERAEVVAEIARKEAEIRRAIAEQARVVAGLRAAARRAREAAAVEAVVESPGAVSPPPGPIPAPSPGARLAIEAAYSVLGTPYRWGGASPATGFDCSGLTMWAWAQAGVSLPHSSELQYAVLPHVPREELQPGDLVFFYSPIHHVGLYIGGGRMIDAPHSGAVVAIRDVDWGSFVGAARPG